MNLLHRVPAFRVRKAASASSHTGQLVWLTNIPTPYRLPLWKCLAARRELRVVFMSATEPNRQWDGVRLAEEISGTVIDARRMPSRFGESPLYLPTRRLHEPLHGAGAVVIDGWESPAYIYAAFLCRLRHVPVVYFYRSTLETQSESATVARVRGWLFRRAGAVLTGGLSSTEAVAAMGVAHHRIVQGINPVDVESFRGLTRVDDTEAHRYVYVGQLIGRKNVDSLIRACATLTTSYTLSIVGDGPERQQLEALVSALSLEEKVTFVGHATPPLVAEILARSDTLVLPSSSEVYGLVVPEALAAGLHCVVSATTGVAATVSGMRGVYTAEPVPAALATAMVQSSRDWTGPLPEPEILAHTAARHADLVEVAVQTSAARHDIGSVR